MMKRVICNSSIPIARRLNMAKAMLITKILHSAAGWGLLDARETKKNHSNVMWIFVVSGQLRCQCMNLT